MYDPDITGVGDQPDYYDFWTSLYDKYYVLESEILVRVTNTSTGPVTLTVTPVGTTVNPWSSLDDAREAPWTKAVVIPANGSNNYRTIKYRLPVIKSLV